MALIVGASGVSVQTKAKTAMEAAVQDFMELPPARFDTVTMQA